MARLVGRDHAREAAAGKDVRVGGGIATIQRYLRAGLIDALHLAVAPILLGSGEALFAGVNLRELGYRVSEFKATEKAAHYVLTRAAA